MRDLIKSLTSGFNMADGSIVRNIIMHNIEGKVKDCWSDNLGNILTAKYGKDRGKRKKIMLLANMNVSGVMATHILENGLIKITPFLIKNPVHLYGQKVIFKNGVVGVIVGNERNIESKHFFQQLYVDIGSESKEETEEKIELFSKATFLGDFISMEDKVLSKNLDNMVSCAILIKLIKEAEISTNDLYVVFANGDMHQTSNKITSVYNIKPDIVIEINLKDADIIEEKDRRKIKVSAGPIINVSDENILCNDRLRKYLEECAKKNKIVFQYDMYNRKLRDYDKIHSMFDGILTGSLSIPCKYKGSPFEMISIKDVEEAVKMLKSFLSLRMGES